MFKLLIYGGMFLAVMASYAAAYHMGGNHREASLKLEQANADLVQATYVMGVRNDIDKALMASIPPIFAEDDGSVTGPAVGKLMQSHIGQRKPVRDPGTP